MGVTSFSQEFTSPVSAAHMFNACVTDSNNLIPKLLPQFIRSIEVIQGDGAAGTIEQSNIKYAKHRIDELDKECLVLRYTIFEGDFLGNKIGSIVTDLKFDTAASGGGCMCKMTKTSHLIDEANISEEEIKADKDQATGIFKVVENPHAYA